MPVFDPQKSKIKMVILTKPKHENEVWWSVLKHNKRPNDFIIAGMLERLKKTTIYKYTQVVQFYENGKLIKKLKAAEI